MAYESVETHPHAPTLAAGDVSIQDVLQPLSALVVPTYALVFFNLHPERPLSMLLLPSEKVILLVHALGDFLPSQSQPGLQKQKQSEVNASLD